MFLWHINKPKNSLNISFFYVALRIKTSLRNIENEKYLIKWRNQKLKYSKRRDSNWLSIGVFLCWKWQIKPGFMAKWHVRGDICNQKKQLKRRENVFATQHYFLRKKNSTTVWDRFSLKMINQQTMSTLNFACPLLENGIFRRQCWLRYLFLQMFWLGVICASTHCAISYNLCIVPCFWGSFKDTACQKT